MSENENINKIDDTKLKNKNKNLLNPTNEKENKEINNEMNLLNTKITNQINLNEDSNFKSFDFNINPFNENSNEEEFADNENNKSDDEEFVLVENDIKNNFIPYNNITKLNEENRNYYSNEKNINQIYIQNNNLNNINYSNNNNNIIPRVPSNPLPSSYNNINNNNYNFYQNPISNSLNTNNNYSTFNIPNNLFTMNGKSGWICSNCKNFNYESKYIFFFNFFLLYFIERIQCNRCGRTQSQILFNNGNNYSTGNLFSNNIINENFQNLKNLFNYNNINKNCIDNLYYDNNFSSKNKNDINDKKKKKPFIEREGDWICIKCNNLNFSFRNNCNRCNFSKTDNLKFLKKFMSNN